MNSKIENRKPIISGIVFGMLLLATAGGCGKGGELKKMLPDAAAGWSAATAAAYYDGEKGIFDYMNGGAEVYLAYDFSGLAARKYRREGLPQLEVGVYDMGSPRDAYGIFSFERSAPSADVGQGSEYDRGLLRFWQGKYFYMLAAEGEAPGLREAMIELGNSFVAGRSDCGRGPELVEMLPAEGLDELSVKYFRGVFGLKMQYFLGHEDVLGLGEESEVVLAAYQRNDAKLQLVLVQYASEELALSGSKAFGAAMKDLPATKGKIFCARSGANLAAVFESPDNESAAKLIDETLGTDNLFWLGMVPRLPGYPKSQGAE